MGGCANTNEIETIKVDQG